MKPLVRKILLALVSAAVVAGLSVLLARSKAHRQLVTCEGLKVEFADAHRFVVEDDVKAWLERDYGSSWTSRARSSRARPTRRRTACSTCA